MLKLNYSYINKKPLAITNISLVKKAKRHRLRASSKPNTKLTKDYAIILPGFLLTYKDYEELKKSLIETNKPFTDFTENTIETLQIKEYQWLPTLIGKSYEFYINALSDRIDKLHDENYDITLIAHSAGGWLAKLCLGDKKYMGCECNKKSKVKALVTLGTPHDSLEKYPFGRCKEKITYDHMDHEHVPKEVLESSTKFSWYFYKDVESLAPVKIICVAGDYVRGKKVAFWKLVLDELGIKKLPIKVKQADVAYGSYEAVNDIGESKGDGICPIGASKMIGSDNFDIKDIYHLANKDDIKWYGSKDCVEIWLEHLKDSEST